MAAFAAWVAWGWAPALIGSVPLAAAGLALCYLGLRPPIELCADHLRIGRRAIRWTDIKRVDRLYLKFPLLVRLQLTTGRRVLLVFSGDRESANSLLRNIRRMAKAALRHRLILNFEAEAARVDPDTIVEDVLKSVAEPSA